MAVRKTKVKVETKLKAPAGKAASSIRPSPKDGKSSKPGETDSHRENQGSPRQNRQPNPGQTRFRQSGQARRRKEVPTSRAESSDDRKIQAPSVNSAPLSPSHHSGTQISGGPARRSGSRPLRTGNQRPRIVQKPRAATISNDEAKKPSDNLKRNLRCRITRKTKVIPLLPPSNPGIC